MSFVQTILDSTQELEAPKSYFYWSALTTIAAVLGKDVWINRQGVYNLYPNVYTFLISKKSGLRKGIPIGVARKLSFLAGNIRVIDGQNSIQGVIKELTQIHTLPNGNVLADAQCLLISGEFANFLLQDKDAAPLTFLTDIYDTQYYEDGFRKRLASQDTQELKNPCITGLFASNEIHFRDAVPDNAMRGGFLARCFCVYEDKRANINSLMSLTELEEEALVESKIPYADLVKYLKALETLQGPMRIDDPARKIYNDWYKDFTEREIEDDTGTLERIGDTMLKAAMLIALSRSPEMVIRQKDVDEAIVKTTDCFRHLRKLTLGAKAPQATKNETFKIVMSCLITAKNNTCSRRYLLTKGFGVYDVYDFDSVIEHMVQAGAIDVNKRHDDMYYKLKQEIVDQYMKLGGGKVN